MEPRIKRISNDTRVEFRPSVLGVVRLKWRGRKLASLRLPKSPPRGAVRLPRPCSRQKWENILGLSGVARDESSRSLFYRRVWRAARKIPFGQTRSYAWVARQTGNPRAARAVGRALEANPWPLLVPCHRVIAFDGSLGGFSSGRRWKRYLIDLEKTIVDG